MRVPLPGPSPGVRGQEYVGHATRLWHWRERRLLRAMELKQIRLQTALVAVEVGVNEGAAAGSVAGRAGTGVCRACDPVVALAGAAAATRDGTEANSAANSARRRGSRSE